MNGPTRNNFPRLTLEHIVAAHLLISGTPNHIALREIFATIDPDTLMVDAEDCPEGTFLELAQSHYTAGIGDDKATTAEDAWHLAYGDIAFFGYRPAPPEAQRGTTSDGNA
jgi:hypothetical protein